MCVQTRELWVCVEEFVTVSTRPRDVVECVMATGGESPSLDARHITIHVSYAELMIFDLAVTCCVGT